MTVTNICGNRQSKFPTSASKLALHACKLVLPPALCIAVETVLRCRARCRLAALQRQRVVKAAAKPGELPGLQSRVRFFCRSLLPYVPRCLLSSKAAFAFPLTSCQAFQLAAAGVA